MNTKMFYFFEKWEKRLKLINCLKLYELFMTKAITIYLK